MSNEPSAIRIIAENIARQILLAHNVNTDDKLVDMNAYRARSFCVTAACLVLKKAVRSDGMINVEDIADKITTAVLRAYFGDQTAFSDIKMDFYKPTRMAGIAALKDQIQKTLRASKPETCGNCFSSRAKHLVDCKCKCHNKLIVLPFNSFMISDPTLEGNRGIISEPFAPMKTTVPKCGLYEE